MGVVMRRSVVLESLRGPGRVLVDELAHEESTYWAVGVLAIECLEDRNLVQTAVRCSKP